MYYFTISLNSSILLSFSGGDVGEFTSQEVIASDLTVNVGEAGYLFCGGIGNPAPKTKFLTLSPALEGVLGQKTRFGDLFSVLCVFVEFMVSFRSFTEG